MSPLWNASVLDPNFSGRAVPNGTGGVVRNTRPRFQLACEAGGAFSQLDCPLEGRVEDRPGRGRWQEVGGEMMPRGRLFASSDS